MANVTHLGGIRPIKKYSGEPWSGAFNVYNIDAGYATAAYVGDMVSQPAAPTGNTAATRQLVEVTAAAVTNLRLVGAIVGFAPDPTNLARPYHLCYTDQEVYVCDDIDMVFEAEEDGVTTPIATASLGLNIEIINGTPNTYSGCSAMLLDSNTVATTATLPFRLQSLVERTNNAIGTRAHWLVTMVQTYKMQTLGIA
jgi:hypothetical protein